MSLKLQTPDFFPAFPFTPYDIQLDLMRHVYSAIEARKITIAESPTGTGKTLSLLCASLTWLRDEHQRARTGQLDALADASDGPDWVLAQTVDRRRRELEAEEREYAERLSAARKKEAAMRKLANARVRKRPRTAAGVQVVMDADPGTDDDDGAFLPDSDDDGDEQSNLSPAVRALMEKLKPRTGPEAQAPEPVCTKIYYASRTHSQLAQVLHELRKLRLELNVSVSTVTSAPASSATKRTITEADEADGDGTDGACNARVVSLGGRKQLCINAALRTRAGDLDEACRQMLGEKGKNRCAHLPPPDEDTRMLDLRDQILATPKDIEDLLIAGKTTETCPYFGARRAIPQAQLILLPYNLLLHASSRAALGIDLTGQVVLIDEAHNLVSTLLSLSTTRLPLRTLSAARTQLTLYTARFRTRLAAAHALHLTRLASLLDALVRYADAWKAAGARAEVLTPGELLARLGRKTEGVNLLEVAAYLHSSKIARKVSGYSVKAMERAAGQDPVKLAKLARMGGTTPPLHVVESFITALTSANDDGRVTFSVVDEQLEIKYQHLNPATHFQEVIDAARSVILAGGTMSPISDVTNQLFAQLPPERLSTFSCGHIIPPANLQMLVLKKGPCGGDLQFKYEQRGDQALIAELGQMLLNFASVVPGGMVVFLPSYSFLHAVWAVWERSGLVEKLRAKKKVFSEPQDSGQVEGVLRDYAAAVRAPDPPRKAGALLFAVIGAKLSEGLNFADDLARAVVLVGLPFANRAAPELRERMAYVTRLAERRGAARAQDAATELYENMCMNAVNQSIGRAIRHREDWAALVLVDARYAAPRIRTKLPKWIGEHTVVAEGFGQAMKEMGRFYRERRSG
ncbi:DNA repair helicase [Amylocystis lapponica]|nr:DNA repair helicase [Amylocystis lapponica]